MAQVDPMTGLTEDQERAYVAGVAKNWWLLLILGIVTLIVGIFLMFQPAEGTFVIAILLAIYLVVSGIISIVRGFGHGVPGGVRALFFIGGAIGLLLGLLMFRFARRDPVELIELLGIFVAVWFLFSGILQLIGAGSSKEGRGWAIFAGIVYLLAGFALLVYPWTVGVFVWIAGIWLIVLGLFEVISSFMVRSKAKKLAAAA